MAAVDPAVVGNSAWGADLDPREGERQWCLYEATKTPPSKQRTSPSSTDENSGVGAAATGVNPISIASELLGEAPAQAAPVSFVVSSAAGPKTLAPTSSSPPLASTTSQGGSPRPQEPVYVLMPLQTVLSNNEGQKGDSGPVLYANVDGKFVPVKVSTLNGQLHALPSAASPALQQSVSPIGGAAGSGTPLPPASSTTVAGATGAASSSSGSEASPVASPQATQQPKKQPVPVQMVTPPGLAVPVPVPIATLQAKAAIGIPPAAKGRQGGSSTPSLGTPMMHTPVLATPPMTTPLFNPALNALFVNNAMIQNPVLMTPNAASFLQQGLPIGGFVPVGQSMLAAQPLTAMGQHQLQQLQQQQLFAQAQLQQFQQLQQLQLQLQQQQQQQQHQPPQSVTVGAAAQTPSASAPLQSSVATKQQKQPAANDEDTEKLMWAAHQHLFPTAAQAPTLKAVALPTPTGSQSAAGNGASQSPQASPQGSPQATPQAGAAAAAGASAVAKGQTPKAAGSTGKTPTASATSAATGKKSRQEQLLSKLKSAQIAPLPPSSTSSSPSNPPSKGGSLLPTPTALGNVTFSEAGVHVVAELEATPTSTRIKAALGEAADGSASATLDFKPSYKSKPCRAFIKDRGVCRHGDKCLFSHDPALLDATPTAASPSAAS